MVKPIVVRPIEAQTNIHLPIVVSPTQAQTNIDSSIVVKHTEAQSAINLSYKAEYTNQICFINYKNELQGLVMADQEIESCYYDIHMALLNAFLNYYFSILIVDGYMMALIKQRENSLTHMLET